MKLTWMITLLCAGCAESFLRGYQLLLPALALDSSFSLAAPAKVTPEKATSDMLFHLSPAKAEPLLQIPAGVSIAEPQKNTETNWKNLKVFLDTGTSKTLMTQAAAQKAGLTSLIKPSTCGGGKAVVGHIEAGRVQIRLHGQVTVASPAISIVKPEVVANEGELVLGLDFLRQHKAIINLREDELQLQVNGNQDEVYEIPFIRPRGLFLTTDNTADECDGTNRNLQAIELNV